MIFCSTEKKAVVNNADLKIHSQWENTADWTLYFYEAEQDFKKNHRQDSASEM